MTPLSAPTNYQVVEMRRAFDASFAAPPRATSLEEEQLLAVQVGGARYAIRLSELSGIVPARTIVPLPGRVREALGLAGIRGALVPVYSLAAMLSHEHEHERSEWLVLCKSEQPIALALAELEGYLRVSASDLFALDEHARGSAHSKELVRTGTVSRAVISIPSIVAAIKTRVGPDGRPEE